jgi:hypothetical protein
MPASLIADVHRLHRLPQFGGAASRRLGARRPPPSRPPPTGSPPSLARARRLRRRRLARGAAGAALSESLCGSVDYRAAAIDRRVDYRAIDYTATDRGD